MKYSAIILVLFLLCGCTKEYTLDDLKRLVDSNRTETINNLWYIGSEGEYDFMIHNSTITSRRIKIKRDVLKIDQRFQKNENEENWIMLKGDTDIVIRGCETNFSLKIYQTNP